MTIQETEGSIFLSDAEIICNQVTSTKEGNSGLTKAIRAKWPIVSEQYNNFLDNNLIIEGGRKVNAREFMGLCQFTKVGDKKFVANLFSQGEAKGGRQFTDYTALRIALMNLKRLILYGGYGRLTHIVIPFNMGAENGIGNWDIILKIIKSVFMEVDDLTIEIRKI